MSTTRIGNAKYSVTPWFDKETRPAYPGLYQVLLRGLPLLMLWQDGQWRWPSHNTVSPYINARGLPWRGCDEEQPEDEVWQQRDGMFIPVGEMDDHHVRSVLRMLLRGARRRKEQLDKLSLPWEQQP